MRQGGSKQKGASFERSVCKQLSLWMSHGKREDLYWRSAMSGGRATVAARKGTRLTAQAGDITAIDPDGTPLTNVFLIECKHYKNLQIAGLTNRTGELFKFWSKLVEDSRRLERAPMLIAKQNGYPALVCLSWDGLNGLKLHGSCLCYCALVSPVHGFYAVLLDQLIATGKRPG